MTRITENVSRKKSGSKARKHWGFEDRFSAAATRPQSIAKAIRSERAARILKALKSGLQSRGITPSTTAKGGSHVANVVRKSLITANPKKNSLNLAQRFSEF